MKVLMTTDAVGGVWTYAIQLCRALASREVQVILATMGPPPSPAQVRSAEGCENVVLRCSTYRLEWMQDPWEEVAAAGQWLVALRREFEPDLIHLNGYVHAALRWDAPLLSVAHSCVLSWWQAVKGESAPPAWDAYRARVRRGLHAADLVAAPSRAMLDRVQRHYGPLPRTAVIHNGIDPDDYHPTARKEPLVLSAGRIWDDAKNIAALAAIAPRLAWPVYVAGDQSDPNGGGRMIGGITALGRLERAEMAGWFGRASIYCLPARYEPFGLSALEAACSGCTLVLGDIPSLREIWGDDALFVPPDDPAALRAALMALIENEPLRLELAARARRRARRFAAGRMADEYLSAYADLAAVAAT